MAANKASSTKKTSTRSAATKTSAARTTTTKKTAPAQTKTTVATADSSALDGLPTNLLGIIGAEVIGTFILTLSALMSMTYQQMVPLFVGITMVVLVLVIGAISGAHVNPAVTFGLWASRKLKGILVPFYWAAQMLGAVLAVLLLRAISSGNYNISFSNFSEFNLNVASVEFFGALIFVFGFVAVLSQKTLLRTGKALGIGLSLFSALVVTVALLPYVQQGADMTKFNPDDDSSIPREYSVSSATINPAIAVAATETSLAELQGGAPDENDKQYSRFGLETIIGTLAGAAVGGNLWLLVARGSKEEV